MLNAMTVDVEDYFHVSVFDGVVPRDRWSSLESRVCANTERMLAAHDDISVWRDRKVERTELGISHPP